MIIGPLIRPGVEDIIQFHAVASGSCWAGLVNSPGPAPHRRRPGGDPREPARARQRSRDPGRAPSRSVRSGGPATAPDAGSSGESERRALRADFGFLGCEARPFNPLVSALPRRMVVANAATKERLSPG